ncbi:hypothetical protein B7494_g384 [Chlorociboria aeruginascens]|nr:hypothetical protein B7494_g384 [Chlorociboria aeruginascens]
MARAKPFSLRGFLQKSVLRSYVQAPEGSEPTPLIATEPPLEEDLFDDDEDSLPLSSLERVLQQRSPQGLLVPPARGAATESGELDRLRGELLLLVEREVGARGEELGDLRERRKRLVWEIKRLEGEVERRVEADKIKELNKLPAPEPISPWEKKKLKSDRERVAKALAGKEVPKSKAKRERIPDEDLDGEDRLRLGKKIKVDPLWVGHWKSDTLFDLFPSWRDHTVQELKDMIINEGKTEEDREFFRAEMDRFKD